MPRRKGDNLNFLEFQLFRIARWLESLDKGVKEMGEGQAAIDAAIQNLQSVADGVKSAVDQAVAVMQAIVTKLQSQANAPDFASEIQTLQGIQDSLTGSVSEIGAETAAAQAAVTPAPAAPAAQVGGPGDATPAASTAGGDTPAPGAGATTAENPTPTPAEELGAAGTVHTEPGSETAADTGTSGEAPPVPPPPGT